MLEAITTIPFVGGFLASVIPFIAVLSVIVFVHEYGHYAVGRMCGIGAEVFSIGFGPVLAAWMDRRGTRWQVAAIPFGGYVRFVDDQDPDGDAAQMECQGAGSFNRASVLRRALTVAAGPAANFLLSAVLFALLAMHTGLVTDEPRIGEVVDLPGLDFGLRAGDRVIDVNGRPVGSFGEIASAVLAPDDGSAGLPRRNSQYRVERDGRELVVVGAYPMPARVDAVEPLSPASRAGLRPGDLIIGAGDRRVESFRDLRTEVLAAEGNDIALRVRRGGEVISLLVTPAESDRQNADGTFEKRFTIGVHGALAFMPESYTPSLVDSALIGIAQTMWVIRASLDGLYQMIAGNIGPENLQGPIGIAHLSGEVAASGFVELVRLLAIISTAIGLLNLFPIPVLDGGHLVMFAWEAVAGRKPSRRFRNALTRIGIVALVTLMVFATYNDIMRL